MPPIDPFAPGGHPRHPRQASSKARHFVDDAVAHSVELAQSLTDQLAYDELAATHLTPAEADLRDAANGDAIEPDSGLPALPTLGELQGRVDALVDYLETRQGLEQDGLNDAEAPRITDAFGVEHILRVSEDGTAARWEPVAVGYGDMKVAELKALLVDRDLSVVGNKPDLVARLVQDDAARAAKEETAQAEQGGSQ